MTRTTVELQECDDIKQRLYSHLRELAEKGDVQFDFQAYADKLKINASRLSRHIATLSMAGLFKYTSHKRGANNARYVDRRFVFPDGKVLLGKRPDRVRHQERPELIQKRIAEYLRNLAKKGEHVPFEAADIAKHLGITIKQLGINTAVLQRNGTFATAFRRRGGGNKRVFERSYEFPDGLKVTTPPYEAPLKEPKPKPAPASMQLEERVEPMLRGARTINFKYAGISLPDSAIHGEAMGRKIRILREYGDDVAKPSTRGIIVVDEKGRQTKEDGWLLINGILHSPGNVDARVARAQSVVGARIGASPQNGGLIARYGRS